MIIDSFTNENSFMSNFHPCLIFHDGILFPSVEHAYHASKTFNHNQRVAVACQETPGKSKRYAKKLLDVRHDWDCVKVGIMGELIRKKFMHSDLQKMLIDTYPCPLIEGNEWGDKFWGAVIEHGEWVGENMLGKLLMSMRQELMFITNTRKVRRFIKEADGHMQK